MGKNTCDCGLPAVTSVGDHDLCQDCADDTIPDDD